MTDVFPDKLPVVCGSTAGAAWLAPRLALIHYGQIVFNCCFLTLFLMPSSGYLAVVCVMFWCLFAATHTHPFFPEPQNASWSWRLLSPGRGWES